MHECEIQCHAATCEDAPEMFKPQIEGFLVSTTLFLSNELLESKLHSVRGNGYQYQYETFLQPLAPRGRALAHVYYLHMYVTTLLSCKLTDKHFIPVLPVFKKLRGTSSV